MRKSYNPLGLLLITALWLAAFANIALWQALWRLGQLQRPADFAFAGGFMLLIAAVLVLSCAWLAWRKTIKPVLTLLLLVSAVASYYMLTYSVVLDPTMLVNVLETDPAEARDLLTVKLLLYVLVLAVLPAIWLWRQPLHTRTSSFKQLWQNALATLLAGVLVVGILLAIFQPFASLMRNHVQVRYLINPLSSLWSFGVAVAQPWAKPKVLEPLGRDAHIVRAATLPPKTLLLVVGETARADHFQLNGYARATNPLLAQQGGVVSFGQVLSCGTSTAASLPCMFSHLGRADYSGSKSHSENLLDVLQHAGLAVLWVDNQSGCKGLCDRVPTVSTTALKDAEYCSTSECFDAVMLKNLDAEVAKLPPERLAKGLVIVLHQMGSHGPAYYKRSPASSKLFQPECRSVTLQDCPRQQIVNAFDNSIVYTDFLLNSSILWLKNRAKPASAAMLYVSDHGESLGENNLYLHGLPYAVAPLAQKHVPWISWLGADFGIDANCLQQRRGLALSHDYLFHTVLGAMDVQTQAYKAELDAYAACKLPVVAGPNS